jgi:hypothetical protein
MEVFGKRAILHTLNANNLEQRDTTNILKLK